MKHVSTIITVLVLLGSIASMGAVLNQCSQTQAAVYQAIK